MRRSDLRRFHDLASGTKTRGQGIGFAGVGIKLGLLVSDDVVTASRRGKEHVSTTWMLTNRRRARWRWIPDLAASLTLNKADFLRSGPRGASFLAYRKAMQEAVSAQLAQWGDAERADETQHRRVGRPIERDMESALADLRTLTRAAVEAAVVQVRHLASLDQHVLAPVSGLSYNGSHCNARRRPVVSA